MRGSDSTDWIDAESEGAGRGGETLRGDESEADPNRLRSDGAGRDSGKLHPDGAGRDSHRLRSDGAGPDRTDGSASTAARAEASSGRSRRANTGRDETVGSSASRDDPTAVSTGGESSGNRRQDGEDPPGGSPQDADDADEGQKLHVQRKDETDRWTGLVGIALLTGGVGLVASIPSLFLASAVCVGVLGFVQASSRPTPSVRIEREFGTDRPEIGDEVTVTIEVRNVGDGTLPDLRLIDLVPDGLAVVEGSPRTAVTLRPGETATLTYTVTARRGCHEFDGSIAIVRGFAGTVETEYRVDATDSLAVPPRFDPVETVALRSLTTPYAGRVTTDEAGEGIEFHTVREYRPGDPLRRIDWNRRARGDDLATLEFRTEQAASVVLVADVRPEAYVRPNRDAQSAADLGIDAICRLFPAFLDHGDRVGIGTMGPQFRWLAPSSGDDHRARARELLGDDPAFSPAKPSEQLPAGLHARRIRRHLSEADQIVVCSPLCDDGIERAVRMLDAHGHQATVISPDPTVRESAGQKLARTERFLRIARLRRAGVRVIDWEYGTSLDTALARASERWSA